MNYKLSYIFCEYLCLKESEKVHKSIPKIFLNKKRKIINRFVTGHDAKSLKNYFSTLINMNVIMCKTIKYFYINTQADGKFLFINHINTSNHKRIKN